jgi:predicted AAA+ superfamily ATPase
MLKYKEGKRMYFKRDISAEMARWKTAAETKRVALEIIGARQVGKTFISKDFAEHNFDKVYYINLFDEPERGKAKKAAENHLSMEDTINFLINDFEDSADNVIIVDEVQESAHMYNLIRPILSRLKSQLILTGSFMGRTLSRDFLGVNTETIRIEVQSLSFAEFTDIFGKRELYNTVDLFGGSAAEEYEALKELYKKYLILGGHPSVLNDFFDESQEDKLEIINARFDKLIYLFCEDSSRYFKDIDESLGDTLTDRDVLPRLINNITKYLTSGRTPLTDMRNDLSKLDYRGSGRTQQRIIKNCLAWLLRSGIIQPCNRVVDLNFNNDIIDARYYFADIGLAGFLFRKANIISSKQAGVQAEQFIFRLLRENKLFGDDVSYGTYGEHELDFVAQIQINGELYKIAVEVKNSEGRGKSAFELLEENKIDFLFNVKGNTVGGAAKSKDSEINNIFTIPPYLFGRLTQRDIRQLIANSIGVELKGIDIF